MSFRHIDISGALARLAERKIEQAMEEGKFANLKGAGEPVCLDPLPPDESARATYWAMRIFKQNEVVPDEFRYRKHVENLTAELAVTGSETRVRAIVAMANAVILKLNTMGTNVRDTDLATLDVEAEVARFRGRAGRRDS